MELLRRQFLEAVGAAGVAATVDRGRFAQRPDGPNVVLIIIDTLRADHVRDLHAAEVTMTDRWLDVLLDRLHP